mmetsp:Transcript_3457/g.8222  ORF Transcript_3457/g.8222 Transcript_3457/m.8222 type:complete len:634 (+) Transcript_3457:154-2055(+)|eukprot:CAMPEP_0113483838 /NCGR_PEP_ID=MMETSP0014_2-20120614/23644_1 /TAXON_ID=2857 /ORGANISM="Nitzschia sp." /LENGTH=633 /DNA_ID=CAMNT_0000377405 /DNA_START=118 /DNA_END=2019 /DNA_ORIENTATION=- /assembly_acc=CAM_ASM_000159
MSSEEGGGMMKRAGTAVIKEVTGFRNGLSVTGGDMGSLCQLFFDNLSTLLGVIFALQGLTAQGDISASKDFTDQIIWGQIVPGVGITMVIGNIYYSWQAIRLTNHYGRQYTAQPYGLNTPGAFAFVFNIMYTVFFSVGGGDDGFALAYKVALAANFITGAISVVLGIFGRTILKVVPPAALLVPIAGIGFAFLGLAQLAGTISVPIVGYNTIIWVFLGWYAGIRIGWGNFRIPEAVQVISIGIILGWATGLNTPEMTQEAAKLVKWWGPVWTAGDIFEDFSLIKDYLGIIIPLGISATATSLMCLVSAKEAGDPFPVRESMIVDGIGTMIASFFGSPFGTVIYIGHPAYKASGAKVGYSLFNGFFYWIFSWFGILALLQSIVNPATVGPIVFFVGLQVCEEALNFMPSRHYSAFIIGLFPSVYDWVTQISGTDPLIDFAGDPPYAFNSPTGGAWVGVLSWKRGALLVSMLWTAIVVNAIDRQWKVAIIWSLIASLFAVFGIIHVPEAGFENINTPFPEQCWSTDGGTTVECWEFAYQWMFCVAYVMLAATFGIIMFCSRYDSHIEEPIDDESRHAFDDWFKDAWNVTDAHGHVLEERTPGGEAKEAPAEGDKEEEVEPMEESPEADKDEEEDA